ncbi:MULTISPECIES: pyrroline-5-carboxylate reductase [Prochlorococcus]|uniref:Pyrroline-5-carboxylate reductase n=1 Tax=Prochlorococcus marinus (strain SARG / CCMP1375 / SS120) TaxID=167539 RepID=Q7VDI3_PROMA|nr:MULTISPECIES: pyrroline-5-carboxylate reductase [Prochlorococcus]AAP99439.1 Pyrroline-5-carboxylate reductase [Prochlorococcus marinus subsp. marinus str. CCMP1375]KGG11292.1 Pyrroline-5-carboxylate reductase [Prochlorococcus marinus str. LG]KGG18754.1 Pyrroline-5-carboxylate reductase [Prochlorococcus marinus str. SS2]KGG23027.1 Pyrroline-5-carboxylate reductase [Prochlorococcus marinus str. SS35]KGG33734.1 Pyrroline-5-carboxylate reductase [Prochlorococcus marinus str. SS51]
MACSLGVIGLGRMAQVILQSLFEAGQFNPEEVFGVVGKKNSVERVLHQFKSPFTVVDVNDKNAIDVWNTPVKILAVKPQQLNQVQEKCSKEFLAKLPAKPLLISILAGVKLKRLQSLFPDHVCVRAVPNTPALVSAGLTGLSWGEEVTEDQKSLVESIFKPISQVFELPEDQLDAFLALTSSGPAYLALISEALADGAVAAGLPRALAQSLTNFTLEGTAILLKKKELHPGQLKDMVASPAGTTISALRHLEKEGVRSALIEAVILAAKKSREMA